MTASEHFGTNKEGSANTDYCIYCYKDGAFTSNLSLEETIEEYANIPEACVDENGNPISKEQAIANMKAYMPTLKRWKNS